MIVSPLSPEQVQQVVYAIEQEVGAVIVGQKDTVRSVLICLLGRGHVLLEGVPGLGKTMLVRTLAQVLRLRYSRIQFTPDLMPADIVGTNIISEDVEGRRSFRFEQGPIFANLVLADEINRATPKTQSALLEAMQEHTVTVANTGYSLPQPFFVLATQNPLEMEGTYPLPEAQLDRFFFKVKVNYPAPAELEQILERTTSAGGQQPKTVVDAITMLQMADLAREMPIASHVLRYASRLVLASHPNQPDAPPRVRELVRYGPSPRGAQALVLAAKIKALLDGHQNVAYEDIRQVAHPALRHRIVLNFEADVQGVDSDAVIDEVLRHVEEE